MTALAVFEEIIDASGVAPRIEALLPIGVRHRQLRVRTLLAGMMLSQAGHRPAHLTRVRDALIGLPEPDRLRLGVTEDRKTGPHLLTYRQTERTFGLVAGALGEDHPDGLAPDRLQRICDALLEASIPEQFKDASASLAVDWTTTAPSSATAACTAPRHRARCWNSGRSPAPPPGNKPRTGNTRPPSWPGTSSAASPATTKTATTACNAPPPWARSAARSAPPR